MHRLQMFSWGYWNWGNSTEQFVEMTDAVEASRGFAPPVFADVRISRSVRAIGFRENAFAAVVGNDRYRWFRGLGNRAILNHGGVMKIDRPQDAAELLDYAISVAKENRRVIFFCSCPAGSLMKCHRSKVQLLLQREADSRGMALDVDEWAGGGPVEFSLEVDPRIINRLKAGTLKAIPLGLQHVCAELGAVPWGSLVRLNPHGESVEVLCGPPKFQQKWVLPVISESLQDSTRLVHGRRSACYRKRNGLRQEHDAVRFRTLDLPPDISITYPPRRLTATSVYTIVHPETLAEAAASKVPVTLIENKRWVSASKMLKDADSDQLSLPIVFADATNCSRVIAWGLLTSIVLREQQTRYTVIRLEMLARRRHQSELILASTGEPIAEGFIRPYALVQTPSFVRL